MSTNADEMKAAKWPSAAMLAALRKADKREHGNICPVVGVCGEAETMLLRAMDRRGFVEWDGEPWQSIPRVSQRGRAIARATGAR